MRRYTISTVSRKTELQIAEWAKLGQAHPKMEQFKHGDHLNQLAGGRYSANIIGFVLVGRFEDPEVAFEGLQAVEGRFWELLDLTQEQARPLENFAAEQDCSDVGTDTIVCDLLNVEHLRAHICAAREWNLSGLSLRAGAVVLLPVSDQAKEWLTMAREPQNTELRNVRVNNLQTGRDYCEELRLCTNNAGELAILVHYGPISTSALELRLWWLTRMLNLFMPQRIAEIKRHVAA